MATPVEILQLINHLKGQRSRREARLINLQKWICPWRGRLVTSDQPDHYERENPERFTGIAADCVLRGASGMTSGMTPRNISWFKPVFYDEEMMELTGARDWLDKLDRRMKETLAAGGFYQAIQNFNTDLLWSGAGLLYTEKGKNSIMDFYCIQPGSYLVQTNTAGWLEACARQVTMSVSECAERFGEGNLSDRAKRELAKRPFAPITIWHVCIPNPRPKGDKAVASYYIEDKGRQTFLHTGGYHEMPYFFTVWNEGATPYGTGPGDNALPDAMQMDMLERNKLAGLAKLVDPPVLCPPELKDSLDLSPGAINYVSGQQQVRPILDLSPYAGSLGSLQQEIAIVANRLEKALMSQVFSSMPLDQRPAGMSATEFLERKREALQQLGPIMSAYEPQVLTPMLVRVCNALQREGLAPPEPESLANIDAYMKMDFISPMANALRQTGAETTRALIADVIQMCQGTQKMDLLDKLDFDQAIDELATGLAAPGNVIRSDEDVRKLREERVKEQQQMQMMQMMQQGLQEG